MIWKVDEAKEFVSEKVPIKKEEVWKPFKVNISLWEWKGTIVSIFYWKNRQERRMKSRIRLKRKK